jgi:hypothetical protein
MLTPCDSPSGDGRQLFYWSAGTYADALIGHEQGALGLADMDREIEESVFPGGDDPAATV